MDFNPTNVWSWFRQRPIWLKVILFVFIILAIAFAAVVAYFMRGHILNCVIRNGLDPLQTGKDAAEKHFWRKYRDAEKRDVRLTTKLGNEDDVREGLRKERTNAAKENVDGHGAIDSAGDFDDVDDVLRRHR